LTKLLGSLEPTIQLPHPYFQVAPCLLYTGQRELPRARR